MKTEEITYCEKKEALKSLDRESLENLAMDSTDMAEYSIEENEKLGKFLKISLFFNVIFFLGLFI